MSRPLRLLVLAAPLALLSAHHEADARPPAYTIHAGFTTGLHGVTAKPDCVDDACEEHLGQAVAEGATDAFDAPVTVVVREYRDRKNLGGKELEELAHKSEHRHGAGTERRLITGQVAGRPAVELWTTDKPCTPELHARVLVALPDKVVEVETTAKSEDKEFPSEAIEAMDSILRGVRIRRLADVSVDPSAARPDEATLRPFDYLCAAHVP